MNIFKKIYRPIKKRLLIRRLGNEYPDMAKKELAELAFQIDWAKQFSRKSVQEKCREYWVTHRFLSDINRIVSLDDAKILDVGCGISTVLHFIDGKEKIGLDPLASHYQKYYDYPDDINLMDSFGEDINFPDNEFDAVFCTNVIDHVTNPEKTISEIRRILKPNGHFIMTIECFSIPEERDPAHPWSMTRYDATNLLKDFDVIFEESSPFLGLRAWVDGMKDSDAHETEYIFIATK